MKGNSIFKSHNDLFQTKPGKKSQKGQGMTEYLAATALIGVASITTLGFFGETLQSQFASLGLEVAGDTGVTQQTTSKGYAEKSAAGAAKHKHLGNFQGQNTDEGNL